MRGERRWLVKVGWEYVDRKGRPTEKQRKADRMTRSMAHRIAGYMGGSVVRLPVRPRRSKPAPPVEWPQTDPSLEAASALLRAPCAACSGIPAHCVGEHYGLQPAQIEPPGADVLARWRAVPEKERAAFARNMDDTFAPTPALAAAMTLLEWAGGGKGGGRG